MPQRSVLTRVMRRYKRAWETRDPQLAAALFTEDAEYHEDPFDQPLRGTDAIRRYWAEATGGQRDIRFEWQPVVETRSAGVVTWQASFKRTRTGKRVSLRGVMLLELRGERIARFREFWHRREPSA